ncbi:MAG: hypothetical protein KGL43_12190, partial [Burkholderiales bacterium]|nr:hypothetical protein [Burkholderiales bacterium]
MRAPPEPGRAQTAAGDGTNGLAAPDRRGSPPPPLAGLAAEVAQAFAADGAIARSDPGFAPREVQDRLAQGIAR